MRAVAAARQWWAAQRPQAGMPAAGQHADGRVLVPAASAHMVRVSSLSLIIAAATLIVCVGIGFAVTQYNDHRFAIERHAAFQQAFSELQAVFGNPDHFDSGQLRLIERRSGLKDLRFGADPAVESGREVQSLQDASGRIVGWFSWAPDLALIRAMDWLWSLSGAIGIALLFFAVMTQRATWRLARALRRSQDITRKLTSEDALTGLPNQRVVLQSLESILDERERGGCSQLAFALLDLDGLREVNDTLGRNGGDDVMLAIAVRLQAGLPDGALLGRFEDDEFAAIARGDDPEIGTRLAKALHAALSEPIVIGQAWQISGCVGIALSPEDGTSAEELARRAALALRVAKEDGHGATRRYAAQIESEHADRRFLLRELKAAIAAAAFGLHYQPIVAAAGGAIIGVEALLRWTHPSRGAIAPSTFIPIAERYGLMQELGEFVLRRALSDAVRWPDLFVAVNLSPVQIRDPHFVQFVGAVIAQTGIEPSRVVLEVTEGILIADPQEMQVTLEALRALGLRLALDDFGTGYSSLSYLQKFPFHRLKIDRAFVAALGTIGNAGAIIHSIVTLGHALGMIVLAEGVETDQQRVLLRLAGCDEMQGFLFAKPRPAEAVDKIVQRFATGRATAAREPAAAPAEAS
jgi:diguanylate cyclase (GGDEF)-like protein